MISPCSQPIEASSVAKTVTDFDQGMLEAEFDWRACRIDPYQDCHLGLPASRCALSEVSRFLREDRKGEVAGLADPVSAAGVRWRHKMCGKVGKVSAQYTHGSLLDDTEIGRYHPTLFRSSLLSSGRKRRDTMTVGRPRACMQWHLIRMGVKWRSNGH